MFFSPAPAPAPSAAALLWLHDFIYALYVCVQGTGRAATARPIELRGP
jgi:hypothetical protein